jgi:hypothetical protein
MRPSHILPVVALAFALVPLAPLARGDGQPDPKQPKAAPKEPPKGPALPDAKLPPAVSLPITRVVLFNAGVAYFHREGDVTGEGRLDLRFDEADVNDLLKSLVLTDKDGGKVRAVTYDNRMPIDVTLKGFAVDVTENPTMGQLMHQVRGEKVEVADKGGVVTAGQIVSVERPPAPASGPAPGELLNVLTDDGLQTVELKQLKKIRFVRAELQAEFKRALELLAAARGDNKKAVSVVFSGNGKRKVAVGYVTEAPLWKPSYRLSVDEKGAARLQGWATVENTTDEDWVNVKVGLVAGRPVAFQMDLYDPLFVPRPTVEPDLFASLRPPLYQGGLTPAVQMGAAMGNPVAMGAQNLGFGGGFGGNPAGNLGGAANLGVAGGFNGGAFGQQAGNLGNAANLGAGGGFTSFGGGNLGQFGGPVLQGGVGAYPARAPRPNARALYGDRLSYAEYVERTRAGAPARTYAAGANRADDLPQAVVKPVKDPLDKEAGALAAADAALGDMFEYTIEEPITLARQKSALLPLVNEPVEGARVSIFNEATLAKHPLLGLRLVNKTKLHLAQGPVAVYDGGTYAGDARLPDLKPGETRLVSYAIDLGTEVVAPTGETKSTLLGLTLADDKVMLHSTLRRTTTYLVRNRNPQDRTVILEHPRGEGWRLVTPAKPDDRTRDFYRFDVPVKSGALATFEVTEESPGREAFSLAAARDGLLGSEVVVRVEETRSTPQPVSIADGKVTLRSTVRRATTYQFRNRQVQDRTIAVEHPLAKGWKLVAPAPPAEQPRGSYRFDVAVKGRATAALEVAEESVVTDVWKLTDASRDNLLFQLAMNDLKPGVREAFRRVLDLREKADEAQKGIDEEQAALKEIADDQDRIRKNIEKAPRESDAFKRYLKKFDEQETEIEKRQARVKALRAELAKHEKALRDFANGVKAE